MNILISIGYGVLALLVFALGCVATAWLDDRMRHWLGPMPTWLAVANGIMWLYIIGRAVRER